MQSFSWVKTLLVAYTCFALTFHSFVWSDFIEPKMLPQAWKSSPAGNSDPSEQLAWCLLQGILYTNLGSAVTVKETQSSFAVRVQCSRKLRARCLEAWGTGSKHALSPLYTHDYNGLSAPACGIWRISDCCVNRKPSTPGTVLRHPLPPLSSPNKTACCFSDPSPADTCIVIINTDTDSSRTFY